MKKITFLLKPKIIILITAFLVICVGTTYAITTNQKEELENARYNSFHHSFFGDNIFAEMEQMERQMNKVFEDQRKLMAKMIYSVDKNDKKLQNNNSLAFYQDQAVYRYELIFNSFNKDEIMVSANDGILTIAAKNEKSEKKKAEESHSLNSLFYSIPIASDVDGNPEIKREEGKITITFKKLEKTNSNKS